MIWNHPAALAGLALVALPVLVHLLVRRHAARVMFPAMRFVPAVRAAAVRLRAPSDLMLLLLRAGIVVAAVLATAQPLLMTAARERAWASRIARAVVVDTSPSVPAGVASRMAEQAGAGAFVSRRIASPDLRDAMRRAIEWLDTAPAATREIVVVSDFQRGAIDEADLLGVPATTGVGLLRAAPPNARTGGGTIDGWGSARWNAVVMLDAVSTQVTWTRAGETGSTGLTVRASADDRVAAERAASAARSFGVSAGEGLTPVEVSFAGAGTSAGTAAVTPWIASAAMALHASPLLAETGADVETGERAGVFTVRTTLPASSPLAPAVIRAAVVAAAPVLIDPEAETAAIDDAVLSRWRRTPAPIASGLPRSDESDGRWFWALALALLIVETLVRQRGAVARDREVHADAA
jgi:Aerotolerance regulator N-terminal